MFDNGVVKDRAVVILAGTLEKFFMLAAARNLRCPVIYIQDVVSWWYQGSSTLPNLQDLCEGFLKRELGERSAVFFGQSSGAYVALVASTYFKGSTLIACGPQTFPDGDAKRRINFVGIRALSAPDDILDVRPRLQDTPDETSSRNVIIAAGEMMNPASAHYWMDYLHMLHVADVPGVSISVVSSDMHAIVQPSRRLRRVVERYRF